MFEGMEIGLCDKNGTPIKCGDTVKEVYTEITDDGKETFITYYTVKYDPEIISFGFYEQNPKKKQYVMLLGDCDYNKEDFEIVKTVKSESTNHFQETQYLRVLEQNKSL
jgi:hypothetical protein